MADDVTNIVIKGDATTLLNAFNAGATRAKKFESEMTSSVNALKKGWGSLAGMLAIPLSVAGLAAIGNIALETMHNLELMSQKVGVNTDTLQVFGHMAKLSGTDLDGVSRALSIMSKGLLTAETKGEDTTKAFRAMGVSVRNSNGDLKSSDQILIEVADKFKNMEDGTTKTGIAMLLFGRAGKDMIPILNQGGEGIQAVKDKLERLGILIDKDTIRSADSFKDSLETLGLMTKGLSQRVMGELSPALDGLVRAFIDSDAAGENLRIKAEVIANVIKGVAMTVIGAVAAFDIMGTAIGNFIGLASTLGMDSKSSLDDYGISLEDLGIKATKTAVAIAATKNPSIFDGLDKKLEYYGNIMDSFWKKSESPSKASKKTYNPTFDSKVDKAAAAEADRINKNLLTSLTAANKEYFDQAIADANNWLMVQRENGAYELDLVLDYYEKKNDAIYTSYSNEWDYIEEHITRESEKEAKLSALDAKYSKESSANDNELLKNKIEFAKKKIKVEADLYKTINEYSDESGAAEIAALGEKLKEDKRYTDNTGALAEAQAKGENAIYSKREKAILDYYQKVGRYGADAADLIESLAIDEHNRVIDLLQDKEAAEKAYQEYKYNASLDQVQSEKKASLDKLAAYQSLYKDLQGYEGQYYEVSKQLLKEKAATELAILLKGVTDYKEIERIKQAADQATTLRMKQLDIEKGKSSDNFFDGVAAGFAELELKQTRWGQAGYQTFKAFTFSASSELQKNLFEYMSGNFSDTNFNWQTMLDSMKTALSKTLADMISEAVTKDIVLIFKSEWTADGSNVLGIVNKVLGFAGDLFSSNNNSTGLDIEGSAGLAYGGWVPGSARVAGNSPLNDSVRSKLSPDEYVVPRSVTAAIASQGRAGDTMIAHINPAEAALLKVLGGRGTINPRTGLPEFYGSGWEGEASDPYAAWDMFGEIIMANRAGRVGPGFSATVQGPSGEDFSQIATYSIDSQGMVHQTVTRTDYEGGSSPLGDIFGDFAPLVQIAAQIPLMLATGGMSALATGAIVGGTVATGNIAGNLIQRNDIDLGNVAQQALIAGVTAGALRAVSNALTPVQAIQSAGIYDASRYSLLNPELESVFSSPGFGANLDAPEVFNQAFEGFSQAFDASNYASLLNSSGSGSALIDSIKNAGIKWMTKKALNMALGSIFPETAGDSGGHMDVSYMGAEDHGLLASLANTMKGMTGESEFPMPVMRAHKGYFPTAPLQLADKEMPVLIENDETIFTSGNMKQLGTKLNQIIALSVANAATDRPIQLNLTINLDGRVVSEYLYRVSSKGMPVVHKNGVKG